MTATRSPSAAHESSGLSPAKQALLEQRLRQTRPGSEAGRVIPPRRDRASAPLSHAQQQMWVIDQMSPGNPAYNLPSGYRIRGSLDADALERSLNAVIARHEGLRTTFAAEHGVPRQHVHPHLIVAIDKRDLGHMPAAEREAKLHADATTEARRSFDLSRLPLIRATLFRLADDEHVLILNLHHIVADGTSVAILMHELDVAYRAEAGASCPLPALQVQYADFAEWERSRGDAMQGKAMQFWRDELAGPLPVLELPADRVRPALQSFAGSNVFFRVTPELTRRLTALAREHECTAFMTFLAAFQGLLRRYANAEDIIIGTPVGARPADEVAPVIGNFLNMAPLRCDVSGDPTFADLLRRTRETTLDAFSNIGVPFESIAGDLAIERDPARNPVFQTMLQVLSTRPPALGELRVSAFHFDLGISQFDLSLHLYEDEEGYAGRVEYCTDLYDTDAIERMASNFVRLLESIVDYPNDRISALTLVTDDERRKLIHEWNDTAADVPEVLVHRLLELQADRSPQRIALNAAGATMSYAALDARANQIARALQERGVRRGDRVGLQLERGNDMVATMLAILKTGAAYVPLDPAFPARRLAFMESDAQLSALVGTAGSVRVTSLSRERVLLLDEDAGAIDAQSAARVNAEITATDVAYVIYTSGSTGQPKGVCVPHGAVANFLSSMAREPGCGCDDVLVAVTTPSFDIAVLELLLPLTRGATVVIATRDDAFDGPALRDLIETHRATLMQATPSTWRLLLEAGWTPGRPFKALIGGETLPRDIADQLMARDVEVWNMYGPTETTVWSLCGRVAPEDSRITIGTPIANTSVMILDAYGQLAPVGVPGELCIGGAGVTLGYHNRPELTSERFISSPISDAPHARLYRTGDVARWLSDGRVEHLGRLDRQLKVRGFRIEPAEVERVLVSHPEIAEAVVDARKAGDGEPRLVAYVKFVADADLTTSDVRRHARSRLPDYMVPGLVVPVSAFPATPNGKVDRNALPDPFAGARTTPVHEQPQSNAEQLVAAVWSELLSVENIGRHDNFFEIGGHSLAALRAVLAIQERTGTKIDPRRLFFQTLSQIAGSIEPASNVACR